MPCSGLPVPPVLPSFILPCIVLLPSFTLLFLYPPFSTIPALDVLFMAITAPFFYYTVKTARPLFQFANDQF